MRALVLAGPLLLALGAGCLEWDLFWPPPGFGGPGHCGPSTSSLEWVEPGLFAAIGNETGRLAVREARPPGLAFNHPEMAMRLPGGILVGVSTPRTAGIMDEPLRPLEHMAVLGLRPAGGESAAINLSIEAPERAEEEALFERLVTFVADATGAHSAVAERWFEWTLTNRTPADYYFVHRAGPEEDFVDYRVTVGFAEVDTPLTLADFFNESGPHELQRTGNFAVKEMRSGAAVFSFEYVVRAVVDENATLSVTSQDKLRLDFAEPLDTGNGNTLRAAANETFQQWRLAPPRFAEFRPSTTIC